jgi:hypothetical protein
MPPPGRPEADGEPTVRVGKRRSLVSGKKTFGLIGGDMADWIADKFDLSNSLDSGSVHRAELGLGTGHKRVWPPRLHFRARCVNKR